MDLAERRRRARLNGLCSTCCKRRPRAGRKVCQLCAKSATQRTLKRRALQRNIDRSKPTIADPRRVGLFGFSNGGLAAVAGIEGTDRFAAAISNNPASGTALIASISALTPNGRSLSNMLTDSRFGGAFWSNKELYLENDPSLNLDRTKTPLLIIHGDLDGGLTGPNTAALFTGLKSLNREVEYVNYYGVRHELDKAPRSVREDYLQRFVQWFGKYLMP
jgi:dipeptidyl aminopeptidase/acylaminoacyl peptidase